MKKYKLQSVLAILILLPLAVFHCSSPSDSPANQGSNNNSTSYNCTLTGIILDASSLELVDSATVILKTGTTDYSTMTDSYGKFSISFNVDNSRLVTLITSKTGYKPDTTSVMADKNSTNNVSPIGLKAISTSGTNTKSGPPAAIYLLSQSNPSIGVKGSGANETVRLTFQIVDSLNKPIDLASTSLVSFRFGAQPGGGEFRSPEYVFSDSTGRVNVYVTSGTKAGVVQVVAEVTSAGRVITSLPVSLAIHSGLPDANHFGIATQYLNFAGYNIFGLKDEISAYLGDKYGNPVRTGTSVYFTTTGGIIGGSAVTNNEGTASVSLMSAEPRPTHPTRGLGFATITATTADENSRTISSSLDVLFSGVPILSVKPTYVDIPNAGSQSFEFEVKDQNNNPLTPNTNITVTVEGDNVKTSGQTSVLMPDTQSKSATKFSFLIYDTADTVDVAKPITVKIRTSGSNGSAELSIAGYGH